jgi:hypothetical protein
VPIEQLILNQLSFSLIGPLFDLAKRHVAHSKDENQWREWSPGWQQNTRNLLIINKLAERVGFERSNERTLKTLGGTGGTVSH